MNHRQRYRAGMSAYNDGQYADTIELLTPVAAEGRGAQAMLSRFYLGQAHYQLGVSLFKHRQFAQASRHFHAAAQADPAGGSFARFLAVCYVGIGQLDKAIDQFEAMLRRDPDDTSVRIRLALAQWKQGQVLEAVATLRAGLCRQADHAELHYQLGVMLAADDDLAEAERLFEKTIALDPSHAGAYERLAQCSSVDGRHDRAQRYLERAHELDPGNARIALQLCLLAPSESGLAREPVLRAPAAQTRAKPDPSALDQLGEVITAEPDFVEAFLALPASDVDNEVFSTLAATIERALAKHPEFADLHYHCGQIYQRLGQESQAIQHAEQAVRINPRYVEALILLARLYKQTDAWQAGLDRLQQALQAGADYPDVHYLIGQLNQSGNRPAEARAAYERALDLNRNYRAARQALEALPA